MHHESATLKRAWDMFPDPPTTTKFAPPATSIPSSTYRTYDPPVAEDEVEVEDHYSRRRVPARPAPRTTRTPAPARSSYRAAPAVDTSVDDLFNAQEDKIASLEAQLIAAREEVAELRDENAQLRVEMRAFKTASRAVVPASTTVLEGTRGAAPTHVTNNYYIGGVDLTKMDSLSKALTTVRAPNECMAGDLAAMKRYLLSKGISSDSIESAASAGRLDFLFRGNGGIVVAY